MQVFLRVIKAILHVLSSTFLFVFLLVYLVVSPVVGRLVTPDGVTSWLSDSNTYENIYDNFDEIVELAAESDKEEGKDSKDSIEISSEIIDIVKKNLPASLVEEKVNTLATNFYDQLSMSDGQLYLRVDLRDIRSSLEDAINTDFKKYLNNLETCKNGGVDFDSDDFNPFTIDCLPAGTNKSEVTKFINELSDMLTDKKDGLGEVFTNVEEEVDLKTSDDIRAAYSYLKLFDFYTIFVIAALALIVVGTARNWLRGVRGLSWMFIAIALPVLVGALLFSNIDIVEVSPVFDDTTTLTSAEQAVFENVAKPLGTTIVKSLTSKMILISAVFLVIGVGVLLATRSAHKKQIVKHPPEPNHSKNPGAHKEAAEKLEEGMHLDQPQEAKPNIKKSKKK